jgi:hypothetical protein
VIPLGFPQATIALSASSDSGGSEMLEWKPRLIAVLFVLIAIAVAAGIFDGGTLIENWEW